MGGENLQNGPAMSIQCGLSKLYISFQMFSVKICINISFALKIKIILLLHEHMHLKNNY